MTSVPPPGMERSWPLPPPLAAAGPPPRSAAELPRRLLWAAALLSALLILVVVNSLLHGGGEALNPLAATAEHTRQAGGARLSIEVVYSGGDLERPIAAAGSGAFDPTTGRSRVRLSGRISPLERFRIDAVSDHGFVYLRSPQFSRGLPAGRPWLGVQTLLGRDEETSVYSAGGTESQLDMLRSATEVKRVGRGRVGRVRVTRYRGSVSLQRVAARLRREGRPEGAKAYAEAAKGTAGPILFEAWVDRRQIAHKLRVVLTAKSTGATPLKMDMQVTFHRIGDRQRIPLPPARRVFDVTPVVKAENLLLDGSMFMAPREAAGSPLDGGEFRKRVNAHCARFTARGEALEEKYAPATDRMEREAEAALEPQAAVRALQRWAEVVMPPIIRQAKSGFRSLQRIPPPSELSSRYRRLLQLAARQLEAEVAEIRAAELGALDLSKKIHRHAEELEKSSDELARELGLPECIDDSDGGSVPGGGAQSATPA